MFFVSRWLASSGTCREFRDKKITLLNQVKAFTQVISLVYDGTVKTKNVKLSRISVRLFCTDFVAAGRKVRSRAYTRLRYAFLLNLSSYIVRFYCGEVLGENLSRTVESFEEHRVGFLKSKLSNNSED